jgi:ribosomal protein S18 acetylase RimI-like enzyme
MLTMTAVTEARDALRSETVRLRDGRAALIRPASLDDAPQLLANINAIGAEVVYLLTENIGSDLEEERQWIMEYDGASALLLVAEVDGKLVGQADVQPGRWPKESHVGIVGIAILDDFRGAGLGRAMMDRVLEWMRDRRFKKACLEVFVTNERAIALYRGLGFEVEGVRKRQYRILGGWVDDVVMGKWLE